MNFQQGSRSYTVLRKTLRLTVEDGSEVAPVDINYVHSIYAPLSVRLVQHIVRNGSWGNLTDVLSLLPGPNLDVTQPGPYSQNRRSNNLY